MSKYNSEYNYIISTVISLILFTIFYNDLYIYYQKLCFNYFNYNFFLGDFIEFYYNQGKMFLNKDYSPAIGFYYPSFAAFLFSFIAKLDFFKARELWAFASLFLNLLFLSTTGYFIYKKHKFWVLTYILFSIFSIPFILHIAWGQITNIVFLLCLFSFILYEKNKIVCSAILLSIAILLKIFPVIFILYFIFKKDYHFLIIAAISTLIILNIPSLFIGFENNLNFNLKLIKILLSEALNKKANGSFYIAFSLKKIIDIPIIIYQILGLSLYLYGGYIASKSNNSIFSFTIISLCVCFIYRLSWSHYFIIFPFACYINIDKNNPMSKYIMSILCFSTSIFFIDLFDDKDFYIKYSILFYCNLFLFLYLILKPKSSKT